ncbi:MAG: hypothetical protein HOV68_05290 [Streptomycetaceae bacterium]|nr:hypothetical protein [Streptomycetaceae bacterium]
MPSRRIWCLAIPLGVLFSLFAAFAMADTPQPSPSPGASPVVPGASAKPTPSPPPAATGQPQPGSPVPGTPAPGAPAPVPSTPRPALTGATPGPPTDEPVEDLSKPPAGGGSDGLMQPFDVTDEDGVPISAYNVKANTGHMWDIDLKIWNILTQFFFSIAKWFIGFACWLIQWALNFELAKALVAPADQIANTIRDRVLLRLGLPGLFLLFAGAYAGWQIMFRQRSRGFAEAGVSLVVAAIATTVLISPAQVLLGQHGNPVPYGADGKPASTMLLSQDGVVGKSAQLSVQVSSLILADDPNKTAANTNDVSKPITDKLVDSFIRKPTQLMLYGRTFDEPNCARAFGNYMVVNYNFDRTGLNSWQAQQVDPNGNQYQQQLTAAGENFQKACYTNGKTKANKASANLMFSALFVAIAAMIVAILVVLVTGTFLTAQGWLAIEAIRGHWALCAGILPGGGRAVLWRWVSGIVKAVLSLILSIIFLAIFILLIMALLKVKSSDTLAIRFIIIDIAAIAGLAGHKRIKETARSIAVNLNRRLVNARIGGSRRSVFTTPGRYAETAPGIQQVWKEARSEARKVTQPIGDAGRKAKDLWVGPRRPQRGRIASAGRKAAGVGAAITTGGATAAAGAAAKAAAKQSLQRRLAAGAAQRMSRTRGGRITLATGRVAGKAASGIGAVGYHAGKAGWKVAKVGALAAIPPIGIPRGVAATRRAGAAASARAAQVRGNLAAAGRHSGQQVSAGVGNRVQAARALGAEGAHNLRVAGQFVRRNAALAQLGMAQPLTPQAPAPGAAPPVAVVALPVPGPPPSLAPAAANGPAAPPPAPAARASLSPSALPAPTFTGGTPQVITGSSPADPTPPPEASSPRPRRRATRPQGPPAPPEPPELPEA